MEVSNPSLTISKEDFFLSFLYLPKSPTRDATRYTILVGHKNTETHKYKYWNSY